MQCPLAFLTVVNSSSGEIDKSSEGNTFHSGTVGQGNGGHCSGEWGALPMLHQLLCLKLCLKLWLLLADAHAGRCLTVRSLQ